MFIGKVIHTRPSPLITYYLSQTDHLWAGATQGTCYHICLEGAPSTHTSSASATPSQATPHRLGPAWLWPQRGVKLEEVEITLGSSWTPRPEGDFPVPRLSGAGTAHSECGRARGGGGRTGTFTSGCCFDVFPSFICKLLNTTNEKR